MALSKLLKEQIQRSAVVQYLGEPGSSYVCRDAIIRLLQHGDKILRADILTHDGTHAFRLTITHGTRVIVKAGFASGYGGTGPHTFSYVLQLLETHGAEIDEFRVSEAFMERIEFSCLRQTDIRWLDRQRPVRPSRWTDYVLDDRQSRRTQAKLWDAFPAAIPFRVIDSRLIDLALTFWDAPADRLLTAFRRLEDVIRERTGLSERSGKLFAQAFLGSKRRLEWPDCDEADNASRGELFRIVFTVLRNPHAHGEAERSAEDLLSEFLVVNQLFRLESAAVTRSSESEQGRDAKPSRAARPTIER